MTNATGPALVSREHYRRLQAINAQLLAALKELLEWSTTEYQSNREIDAQARAAIVTAEAWADQQD
jgi:hypothetical protein